MIDLTILICSTHTRYQTFGPKIQEQIWTQYADLTAEQQERIEILMLTDNKKTMLGEKRNIMVDIAQGKYVVFVDDDDRIADTYMTDILSATETDPDVITFLAEVTLNGGPAKICRYWKDYPYDYNTDTEYHRLPNHICAVRRELALKVSFPNIVYGEDSAYSKLLKPLLKTECHIEKVLYYYDFSDATTETQMHRKGRMRNRPGPTIDVIVLSNATTPELRMMTQRTIDTCIAGANSLPVNVIVMEQVNNIDYRNAETIAAPIKFHYNKFANAGAATGKAPWIMIANNDLIFEDGWLHKLLAANHPLVSPRCPNAAKQRKVSTDSNLTGTENGLHFSGWCFMISRTVWNAIGGFDMCVDFWCSDDVVIEQVKALGIEPMLVPDAIVNHIGSKTLNSQDAPLRDDLTWKNVAIFNEKYGQSKFANDHRFIDWKRRNQVAS
ncbi:glycosyltransferase [Gordonia phage Forza]|uniref:Glycosyltransferase n=1 Tax=Gordonia phage Forza TaxID=2571247 RepID=A0A650EY54_9CAUD|nr:glycosyltransferase [Gordonia phage Forza]QEM41560.1 glycosyltransferase [Gordonia phage Boopy]QGT55086.1 glycosyltransferase [Gordonia phage Forza]UXE04234.1 glycosyltransferase [Gordonia phage BlueNGold]WBF03874.1 glycosyltransferase [Gordonia phage Mareelih]